MAERQSSQNAVDWDSFRREDRSIRLFAVFEHRCAAGLTEAQADLAKAYLERMEAMHPIRSRQVAAHAVATAIIFAMQVDPLFMEAYGK